MELKQQFESVMAQSVNMALATSVDNKPNVRVVTFAYDTAKKGRLLFTTFKMNRKVKEFEQNINVACMPLPMGPESDVQVRIFGTVKKSDIPIDEVVGMIVKKFPGAADTIMGGGDMMAVYEVCFDKADITVGVTKAQTISV